MYGSVHTMSIILINYYIFMLVYIGSISKALRRLSDGMEKKLKFKVSTLYTQAIEYYSTTWPLHSVEYLLLPTT